MSFNVKAYYLIYCLCFSISLVSGQNQKLADSLIALYNSGNYQGDEATLLSNIAVNEKNPEFVHVRFWAESGIMRDPHPES